MTWLHMFCMIAGGCVVPCVRCMMSVESHAVDSRSRFVVARSDTLLTASLVDTYYRYCVCADYYTLNVVVGLRVSTTVRATRLRIDCAHLADDHHRSSNQKRHASRSIRASMQHTLTLFVPYTVLLFQSQPRSSHLDRCSCQHSSSHPRWSARIGVSADSALPHTRRSARRVLARMSPSRVVRRSGLVPVRRFDAIGELLRIV
jgi:hypothetical protein